MKTEYKVLAVFLFIGLSVVVFFGLKNGEIGKLFDSIAQKKFVECTSNKRNQNVSYIDHSCTIRDETGRTVQISYPEIDGNSPAYTAINEGLKQQFDLAKKNVVYDKVDGKYVISSVTPVRYKIMSTTEILSIIVIQGIEQAAGVKGLDTYQTYNFDIKTKKKLTDQDVLAKRNLTSDFSANLKKELITIYANKLGYSYYDVPQNKRNTIIDTMIDHTSYKTLNSVYMDQRGQVSFILDLYNIKQYHTNPYFFKVSSNGTITYTEKFEE